MPFNGSYYENLFVHFMPQSKQWYTTAFESEFGKPLKEFTMADLIESDKKVEEEEASMKKGRFIPTIPKMG